MAKHTPKKPTTVKSGKTGKAPSKNTYGKRGKTIPGGKMVKPAKRNKGKK